MSERVRAVEHGGGSPRSATHGVAAGEQIAHERFAARDQLVGEHVPRARFESPVAQQRGELRGALRAHGEVVVEEDRLSVEEKALAGGRRVVEQLVDERDEPLPEARLRRGTTRGPSACARRRSRSRSGSDMRGSVPCRARQHTSGGTRRGGEPRERRALASTTSH